MTTPVERDDKVVTIRLRRSDCKLTRLWHMATEAVAERRAGDMIDAFPDGDAVTMADQLTPEWN